jgi:hypothetical protein
MHARPLHVRSSLPVPYAQDDVGFWGLPREDAKVEKMRANFTEEDIYRVMKNPHKHTQLGDIHVYNGAFALALPCCLLCVCSAWLRFALACCALESSHSVS